MNPTMTLAISLALIALGAFLLSRVLVGVLKLAIAIAAITLLVSVWQRGTLPWCGQNPSLIVPAHISALCP